MRVEVRGHGIEVSEALRGHVERKLGFALDRFRARVDVVHATFRDLNGSERRGVDQECRIVVVLATSGSVAAAARRADPSFAASVAIAAAARALARNLARRRTRSRQPPRPPGRAPLGATWAERSAP